MTGSSVPRRQARDGSVRPAPGEGLAADLAALRAASERGLPTADATIDQAARSLAAAGPGASNGGALMRAFLSLKQRPWLATAAGAAAVAAVLLAVPISYERTVGHEVTLGLTLPESPVFDQELRRIAGGLRSALHAEGIQVAAGPGGQATLTARAPGRSRSEVEARVAAFARELGARGIAARTEVAPRRERVFASVAALAMGRLVEIRVSRQQSAEEMAAEIRRQFEAAGIQNPEVAVTKDGDQLELRVGVEKEAGGDSLSPPEELPEFRVMVDGQEPPDAKRVMVRVDRRPGMTDEEVLAEVRRQLAEQGVTDAEVMVENGRIQIHRRGE